MSKKVWSGTAFMFLLAGGCASVHNPIGSQHIVDRMPRSEPVWVGKSSWERNGAYAYVGVVASRADMALALREARAEGEKKLAEQIRQRIMTEFGSAIEGQNLDGQTGTYVKDLIAKFSDNVEVSGVRMEETYVEKIEETTGQGVRYVYNCYALLGLDKADYQEARQRVMDGAFQSARSAANAKAEDSLRRAMEKLDSLPGTVRGAGPGAE